MSLSHRSMRVHWNIAYSDLMMMMIRGGNKQCAMALKYVCNLPAGPVDGGRWWWWWLRETIATHDIMG